MPQFESLWAGGPMFAQAEHFRMGTDSILLAHFASPRGRNAIDMGCASGIIGVLMLANAPKLHVTGLEIVPEAAELARENMRVNGFAERSRVVCGDIREHRQLFTAGRGQSRGARGTELHAGGCLHGGGVPVPYGRQLLYRA